MTETHILFIDIYLNKLQTKIKQRLQNFEHYKKIEKNKNKNSSNVKKHRKPKFISTNVKKT